MTNEVKTIDIEGLWLVQGDMLSPIMDLRIDYIVGVFPSVTAVVNDGATRGRPDSDYNAIDTQNYNLDSASINIKLTGQTEPITLFCGYVVERAPVLESSPVAIQSRTRYKLICETELLNTVPPGSLRYYQTLAGNRATTLSFGTAFSLHLRAFQSIELLNKFNETPSRYAAAFLDHIRSPFSQKTPKSIENSVRHAAGKFCIDINNKVIGLTTNTAIQCSSLLSSKSPSATFGSLLQNFWLGWLPQTVAKEGVPSRMIVRSLTGWDNESKFFLGTDMILGFNSVTSFNHTEFVDYYGVVLPPIALQGQSTAEKGTLVAVYGGGFGSTAKIMTQGDFQAAMTAEAKGQKNPTGMHTYASMRITTLPNWWNATLFAPQTVKGKNNTDGTSSNAYIKNDTDFKTMSEDIAKRLATLSFLQYGRAATKATVRVPFYVWLKMLPYLGYTGCIQLIDLGSVSSEDLSRAELAKELWYGGVNALSMAVSVDNKSLRVTCTVGMSQLHTEDEQKEYGAINPMYPHQDTDGGQHEAWELVGKI